MGILWSICCKDGMEPMGPTHSHKAASARMRKQQPPPTPSWGQPSSSKEDGKRSKLLDSGDNQQATTTSYCSINGTGPPPNFSPIQERSKDREPKRKLWSKSHTIHGSGDMGQDPPAGSPTREKSLGMSSIGRSFSLGVSSKKSLDRNSLQKGSSRRSNRK